MKERFFETVKEDKTINLTTQRYLEQRADWPTEGQYILAQYTEDYVVVYQAYQSAIGEFAAEHQYFGGQYFSYGRMSWIKPNFLWMMHRSGWGQKPGQEITLAIKLKRDFFDALLEQAVASNFVQSPITEQADWRKALKDSSVRLQWDPDHDPKGKKETRRAIQLGLRDESLQPFKGDAIIEIEDISAFVAEQRRHAENGDYQDLVTPEERLYFPQSASARRNIGLY